MNTKANQKVTVSVFGKFAQAFCQCNKCAHAPPLLPLATAPVSSVTAQVLCIQLADVMISRLKSPSEFYHVETTQFKAQQAF